MVQVNGKRKGQRGITSYPLRRFAPRPPNLEGQRGLSVKADSACRVPTSPRGSKVNGNGKRKTENGKLTYPLRALRSLRVHRRTGECSPQRVRKHIRCSLRTTLFAPCLRGTKETENQKRKTKSPYRTPMVRFRTFYTLFCTFSAIICNK